MAWNGILMRRPKLGRATKEMIGRSNTNRLHYVRSDLFNSRRTIRRLGGTLESNDLHYDLLIRWGCTSRFPWADRTLNTTRAIGQVNNKQMFRREVLECPHTLYDIDSYQGGDYVVRPCHHAQGRHLYVAHNRDEMVRAAAQCGPSWYATQLFQKTHEYRVFVIQGRAVWVAKKTPGNPEDIAWNVNQGGRFDNVRYGEWPLKVVRIAIEAFNKTELDFGGVDVMWHEPSREVRVLEINSAPSQTSEYRQTCTMRVFDNILETENKDRIPLPEGRGGWRKFAHPVNIQALER